MDFDGNGLLTQDEIADLDDTVKNLTHKIRDIYKHITYLYF